MAIQVQLIIGQLNTTGMLLQQRRAGQKSRALFAYRSFIRVVLGHHDCSSVFAAFWKRLLKQNLSKIFPVRIKLQQSNN